MCREIDENICVKTDATKSCGQQDSRKRSRSVTREDNLRLRPTINVYFS